MARDVRVKICGLRDAAAMQAAARAGAAYLGFVFFAKSPRHLTVAAARALLPGAPQGVAKVALTVDATDGELEAILAEVPLDMLQLHGHESPERVAELRERFGLPVMKAVGVADEADLPALAEFEPRRRPDPRRRQAAAGRGAARRKRAGLRLAADRRAALAGAVDAGRRADGGQCRRGDPADRGAAGRCLVRRRARARRQGPRADRGLHPGGDLVSLRFRTAARADVPAIVALLADDPLGARRETGGIEVYRAAFDRVDADPNIHLIVGEEDGRIVATYQLSILHGLSLRAATRAQMESVRVAADLRSRGIGAALVADAEARARAAGCRLIQLTTHKSRARAHAFYERLGFTASHIGYKRSLDPEGEH